MINIFPLLRPRIKKQKIELTIQALEKSTYENDNQNLNWLNEHRFYLDQKQCERINICLASLKKEVLKQRRGWAILQEFQVNSKMNDSYFE